MSVEKKKKNRSQSTRTRIMMYDDGVLVSYWGKKCTVRT